MAIITGGGIAVIKGTEKLMIRIRKNTMINGGIIAVIKMIRIESDVKNRKYDNHGSRDSSDKDGKNREIDKEYINNWRRDGNDKGGENRESDDMNKRKL